MHTTHAKMTGMVCLLVCLAFTHVLATEKAPESKAARVNETIITTDALNREMTILRQRLLREGKSQAQLQAGVMKKQVLESLIDMELLHQAAQKQGIKVEESDINQRMQGLRGRFKNEDAFKMALSQMGFSEAALKDQILKSLVVQRYIEDQFEKKTTVSDQETRGYYDQHPESFVRPEQVKASHILIKVDPKADDAQKKASRNKILGIQKELKAGADFAELARKHSECPSGPKGGDLGYFTKGQMVKPFEEAAFTLKPGKVSDIVETPFGYHLIRVEGKNPGGTLPYEEIKDKIHGFLVRQQVNSALKQRVKTLKESARVERFLDASLDLGKPAGK